MSNKKLWSPLILFLFVAGLIGCDTTNSLEQVPLEYSDLPGTLITRDTVWTGDLQLKGQYYVLPGVTLTIRPGTTVKWEYHNNNIEDVGALITLPADRTLFEGGARPSGRLVANGTAEKPIVFTSSRSDKKAGDWGGIILAGEAPVSVQGGTERVEGLPQTIRYGGENAMDDSGSLSFVRIEYVGFGFEPGSEINGLSLYGVGRNTTLQYLQVYKSTDDGFEWFGGSVNAKYLISMYADDDSFDMDLGWNGYGQFWVALQTDGADNGVEADGGNNIEEGGPEVYNMTLIGHGATEGEDTNAGIHMRNGFSGSIHNTLIYGFGGEPWRLDERTLTNFKESTLEFSEMLIYGNNAWKAEYLDLFAGSFQELDPLFTKPTEPDLDFTPNTVEAIRGSMPPGNGYFDVTATYIGAFKPFRSTNWLRDATWIRLSDD